MFYDALGIVGGTYGSIVMILFTVYLGLFIVARACVRLCLPAKVEAALGEKKGAAQLHAELAGLRAELAALRAAMPGGLKLLEPPAAGSGAAPGAAADSTHVYADLP